jgi:ABC-type branched-subunit amino acid transport system ATPase component
MHATEAPSQGAMRRLRAQEIAVAYGAVEALRPFSLMLEPGSVVVLGPNGAGKTTLLKALAGLASLRSGRVFVGELEA